MISSSHWYWIRQSIRRSLHACLVILLLLAQFPALATDSLFRFSDAQLRIVQQQLLKAYVNNELTNNEVVDEYLRQLLRQIDTSGRTLIASSRNRTPNAFASWGNIIVVTTGMFDFAKSENELIGVLAHELAHVQLQHFTRIQENLEVLSALSTGTLIITLLSGLATVDLARGIQSLEKGKEYELRRRYEREADQKGVAYLANAKLPINDYLKLITRLGANNTSLPEYASTHPLSNERIASLRNLQRSHIVPTNDSELAGLNFLLVQQRLRVANNLTINNQVTPKVQVLLDAYHALYTGDGNAAAVATLLPHQENWVIALVLAQHTLRTQGPLPASVMLTEALKFSADNLALQTRNLELLLTAEDQLAVRYHLSVMPPEIRANVAIAGIEAKLWQALGDQFQYRVAVAHALFYAGNLRAAQAQTRTAARMTQAGATTVAAGRLALLDAKIQRMRKHLPS